VAFKKLIYFVANTIVGYNVTHKHLNNVKEPNSFHILPFFEAVFD